MCEIALSTISKAGLPFAEVARIFIKCNGAVGRWGSKPLLLAEHEASLGRAGIELVVANGVAANE